MSRLLKLHKAAGDLAKSAPDLLAHPQVARAIEQTLLHAMITCLAEGTAIEMGPAGRRHLLIIARFEEFLATNYDRPLYLAEICTALGVSERTLRICCHEHLGMGPVRYLWLRRMHLARRALTLANPATMTVSQIATDHGFWELGRFAVEYRTLFGKSPSDALRGSAEKRWTSPDDPLALQFSDSA
jgi:AraC-like DNA-binding protein